MRATAFPLWTGEVDEQTLVPRVVDSAEAPIGSSGRTRRGPSQRDHEFLTVTPEF